MGEAILWQRLEADLRCAVDAFPGVAGVAVRELKGPGACGVNADEVFPTASTIKIPILVQLLCRAHAGEIDLSRRVAVPPDQHVLGSGVLAYLAGPVEMTLLDLAILMIIVSDNTATNLCLEAAGMAETNGLLASLGLVETQLRRKMMDHLAAVRELENVSTPAELVTLLALLYEGQPFPAAAAQALEIMKKPKNGFLNKALPPGTEVANKPGWVEGVRCDAGIVYLPRRPYAIALMTKYAPVDSDEHEQFLAATARRVHRTMAALDGSNRYGRLVY
ncbi:MAG TPA: serine hydrolase [Caldilineaceae bacterium]|nr:serine hydrolase [Caldilineaceae bacterium]